MHPQQVVPCWRPCLQHLHENSIFHHEKLDPWISARVAARLEELPTGSPEAEAQQE